MTRPESFGFFYDANTSKQTPAATYTGKVVGKNPDREDGTWDTPTIAWVAFSMQFVDMCSDLHGKTLFIRKRPEMHEVKSHESDEIRYCVIGRFAWEINKTTSE